MSEESTPPEDAPASESTTGDEEGDEENPIHADGPLGNAYAALQSMLAARSQTSDSGSSRSS